MLKDWADVLKAQSFSVYLQKGKFMKTINSEKILGVKIWKFVDLEIKK
jgi:hypothetical protein